MLHITLIIIVAILAISLIVVLRKLDRIQNNKDTQGIEPVICNEIDLETVKPEIKLSDLVVSRDQLTRKDFAELRPGDIIVRYTTPSKSIVENDSHINGFAVVMMNDTIHKHLYVNVNNEFTTTICYKDERMNIDGSRQRSSETFNNCFYDTFRKAKLVI